MLKRLIIVYEAGCKVDLHSVLKYELMPVPVALAEMNGSLRTGQKSVLADVITSGMNCPSEIELQGQLRSINRWSGISFRNWETTWFSNV